VAAEAWSAAAHAPGLQQAWAQFVRCSGGRVGGGARESSAGNAAVRVGAGVEAGVEIGGGAGVGASTGASPGACIAELTAMFCRGMVNGMEVQTHSTLHMACTTAPRQPCPLPPPQCFTHCCTGCTVPPAPLSFPLLSLTAVLRSHYVYIHRGSTPQWGCTYCTALLRPLFSPLRSIQYPETAVTRVLTSS
jgi:hypothetical protein